MSTLSRSSCNWEERGGGQAAVVYKSRTERARLVRARRLRHCLALLPDRPLAPCPCFIHSILFSSQTTPSHHRSRRCHHANRSHYRKAQEEAVARPFSGPRPWSWRWLRLLVWLPPEARPTPGGVLSQVGEAEAGGICMNGKNLDLDWPFRLCIRPVITQKTLLV